jgi:hypothetical protein
VLQRGLRRDEYSTDIDGNHAIHLFQCRLLERFRNGCAGIVHKHIEPAKGRDSFFDCGFDGVGIGGVRLNRDRPSAGAFNFLDERRGRVGTFRVGDGHVCSVRGQALCDCRPNTTRTASNECNLSFKFPGHWLAPCL